MEVRKTFQPALQHAPLWGRDQTTCLQKEKEERKRKIDYYV